MSAGIDSCSRKLQQTGHAENHRDLEGTEGKGEIH
jgi:hypothetical protein